MDAFGFKEIISVPVTPVKNQAHTSTCWSFATISFIESEVLRVRGEQHNLSEMFIVRKTYPRKAKRYVRLHGYMKLGASGLAGDALKVVKDYGLVPEEAYDGKPGEDSEHNHDEMDRVLKSTLEAVIQTSKLSNAWAKALEVTLDAYLGEAPVTFTYEATEYNPLSFVKRLQFDADDYIELTSYTHCPFYAKFVLDIPDNWSLNEYMNVPLDELMLIIHDALRQGYSLIWDGDISENSFSAQKGIGILPEKKWKDRSSEERESICDQPEPEIMVTQESRQECYDNYSSTDDHLMQIVGLAEDVKGTTYYKLKNSWGLKSGRYEGYVYLSESYLRSKTISVMVHRDAVPAPITRKFMRPTRRTLLNFLR